MSIAGWCFEIRAECYTLSLLDNNIKRFEAKAAQLIHTDKYQPVSIRQRSRPVDAHRLGFGEAFVWVEFAVDPGWSRSENSACCRA